LLESHKTLIYKKAKPDEERGQRMFVLAPQVKLFATTGSEEIMGSIFEGLKRRLSPTVETVRGNTYVKRFSNDNLLVQVDDVCGKIVFVIHTQVPPVNDRLFELLLLLDAIKGTSPAAVWVIFPYFPYARSDKKNEPRISVGGRLLADIISTIGVNGIIILDPHDSHLCQYFHPSADDVSAIYLLADYVKREFIAKSSNPKNDFMVVFPDSGSVSRYEKLAGLLGLDKAYINKEREDDSEKPKVHGISGNVRDKTCLMPDDEICTGGTLDGDTRLLMEDGARSVIPMAAHGPLSILNEASQKIEWTGVIEKLESNPSIKQIIVTNSIPISHKLGPQTKFRVLPVQFLIAEAIARTVMGKPLSELYELSNVGLYREG